MAMNFRHIPILLSRDASVSASRFNRVRLALLRLENPLHLGLSGVHELDMVLDDHAWVCVDTALGGFPVLSWTGFEVQGRNTLHEPVNCRINYYNVHADVITRRVLETIDHLLEARLRHRTQPGPRQVSRLRPRNMGGNGFS